MLYQAIQYSHNRTDCYLDWRQLRLEGGSGFGRGTTGPCRQSLQQKKMGPWSVGKICPYEDMPGDDNEVRAWTGWLQYI